MKSLNHYHPSVVFLFFIAILGSTMFTVHPVLLGMSCVGAFSLACMLNRKGLLQMIKWLVPLFVIAALVNPFIVHDGQIILFYVDYKPITLEALLYGFAMSTMLLTVMMWFISYNKIVTSDKFVYLFGKFMPAFVLLITITMRLVPRFIHQAQIIMSAQKTIGMDVTSGGIVHRIKSAAQIASSLVSWALENAIETADSMKARGYGLKNRSSFSTFRFDRADGYMIVIISVLLLIQLVGGYLGWNRFDYYPTFTNNTLTWQIWLSYCSFGLLALLPLIIEIQEAFKWRSFKSTN